MSYADDKTEAEIKALETKLKKVYRNSYQEVKAKADDYFKQFGSRYEAEYAKYKAGEYTDAQFKAWVRTQVARGDSWKATAGELANKITQANQIAAAMVNDKLPAMYALNANYAAYEISKAYSSLNFNLVDTSTVQELVKREGNHTEFKTLRLNPKRDYNWNTKQINNALLAGIIQGKSVKELSDSFYAVQERNKNSAIRNARTAITSAQNAGRINTMHRAEEMGVKVMKEWLATHDSRVRDSHAALDGQIREIDELFDNGLQYPGDPSGEPSEVYNCRCTLVYKFPKYQDIKSSELYSENKQGDETFKQWINRKQKEDVYQKEYNKYSVQLGKNTPSYSDYMKIRNSEDFGLFKSYASELKKDYLSPLADFDLFKRTYYNASRELVGIETSNGLQTTGVTAHLASRIIGSVAQKRNGVDIPKIKAALSAQDAVIVDKRKQNTWNYIFDGVEVSVNKDTKAIIQANPHSRRRKT